MKAFDYSIMPVKAADAARAAASETLTLADVKAMKAAWEKTEKCKRTPIENSQKEEQVKHLLDAWNAADDKARWVFLLRTTLHRELQWRRGTVGLTSRERQRRYRERRKVGRRVIRVEIDEVALCVVLEGLNFLDPQDGDDGEAIGRGLTEMIQVLCRGLEGDA
ncbi:hypothetical protein [Sinorhizobium alkalisoli]|uniref:hypothetical protein n=1 Tax=Sinorhizobium alkalisoli TaxID=1752398 RepID=UPI00124C974A|nr:hypothetical protein [Sinorhizobium alkalisoli]QFI65232.1 hypothetical protein EKH55_0358 [Sinorhizobium alkalisoli]